MTEFEWLEIGYEKGIIETMDAKKQSFEELYHSWFRMKQECIKPQSLDRIEVTWNKYYKDTDFVSKSVSDISDMDVSRYLSRIVLSGQVTEKEMSRIWQIVNNVLIYARDLHYKSVPLHDWERIRRQVPPAKFRKADPGTAEAVNSNDVRKIMEAVERDVYPYHKNCALLLCMNFYMGLRVGELASLTWSDFDLEKKVVRITKTESKFYNRDERGAKLGTMQYKITDSTKTVYSIREIPLLPEALRYYNQIKENHEKENFHSDYLAFDGQESVYVRCLDRTLRKLCYLVGVPYFSTHVIRKTFATRLHFAGVPTRVISDLLGHSEISTTERAYILNYMDNWTLTYNYMKEGLVYA